MGTRIVKLAGILLATTLMSSLLTMLGVELAAAQPACPPMGLTDSVGVATGSSTDNCTNVEVIGALAVDGVGVGFAGRITNLGPDVFFGYIDLVAAPGLSIQECTFMFSPPGPSGMQPTIPTGFANVPLAQGTGGFIDYSCAGTLSHCGAQAQLDFRFNPKSGFMVGGTQPPVGGPAVPGLEAGVGLSLTAVNPPDKCPASVADVLTLTKTGSAQSVPVGATVGWTVTATNLGTITLSNVKISDPLPPSLAIVLPLPTGLSYDEASRTVSASVASLAPGASFSISFDTVVATTSQTINKASAIADGGAYAGANDDVIGSAAKSVPALAAASTPAPAASTQAVAVGALAHTGTEATLGAVGAVLIAYGATAFGVRRHLRVRRED